MTTQSNWNGSERRQCARLAGRGSVGAAVMDQHKQPITRIDDACIVNVGGGGVAFTATTAAPVGSRVQVTVPGDNTQDSSSFDVKIISADRDTDGRHNMRSCLIHGQVPARLIYNW